MRQKINNAGFISQISSFHGLQNGKGEWEWNVISVACTDPSAVPQAPCQGKRESEGRIPRHQKKNPRN